MYSASANACNYSIGETRKLNKKIVTINEREEKEMWISRKRFKDLETRVANLEKLAQGRQPRLDRLAIYHSTRTQLLNTRKNEIEAIESLIQIINENWEGEEINLNLTYL